MCSGRSSPAAMSTGIVRASHALGCTPMLLLSQDFLAADPHDEAWSAVSAILLDPSCSGSGMVRRLDHLLVCEFSCWQGRRACPAARLAHGFTRLLSHATMMLCLYSANAARR